MSLFRANQENGSQDHPGPLALPVPPAQRAYWFVLLLHFLWKALMNPILSEICYTYLINQA